VNMVIVVERPPPLGPGRCPACDEIIIWALTSSGRPLAVDLDPNFMGVIAWWSVELYIEIFPDGDPVDDTQRVRVRPGNRPRSSPAWTLHQATCRARTLGSAQ
jgi:hypothetical protein